jgi:hypothetical protein
VAGAMGLRARRRTRAWPAPAPTRGIAMASAVQGTVGGLWASTLLREAFGFVAVGC